jgi:hypothetical protein
MSDTPETDARTYGFTDEDGIHCEAVHAEFARNLERERNELRAYADKLADGLPEGMLPKDVENLRNANAGLAEDLHKAERERDTACRLLAQMHAAAFGEIQGPDIDPVTDILNLRQGRDQWRECAKKLHAAVCYLEPALLYDDPQGGFTNEREAVREFMRLKEASK